MSLYSCHKSNLLAYIPVIKQVYKNSVKEKGSKSMPWKKIRLEKNTGEKIESSLLEFCSILWWQTINMWFTSRNRGLVWLKEKGLHWPRNRQMCTFIFVAQPCSTI